MKIHSLKVEGITSIKDPIFLDFDKILEGHDLFAITGATGSGKSSLLTSISLAFFGKGYKKIPVENYVSLGKKKASIELAFSTNYKLYTALWSCKIATSAKTGKTRSETKRALFDESGNALDVYPDEIIGLTQEQFFKTVIINQGQFADFLTSSFTHRKKIIEQLYGTEELGLIAPILRRRISDLKIEIELAQAKISGAQNYNEDDIKSFTEELKQTKELLENEKGHESFSHELIDQFRFFKQTKEKLDHHKLQIEQTKQKLSQTNESFNELQNDFNTFNEKLKVNKELWKKEKELLRQAIELLSPLKEKQKRQEQLLEQISSKKKLLQEKSNSINSLSDGIGQFQSKIDKASENFDFKEISDQDTQSLLETLNNLSLNIQETTSLNAQAARNQKEFELNQDTLNKTVNSLRDLDQDIPQKKESLALIKQDLNKKSEQINISQEKFNSITEKIQEMELKQTLLLKTDIELKEKRLSIREEIASLKEDITRLKANHHEKLLNFAISVCKNENHKRKDCIVCDHELNDVSSEDMLDLPEHIDTELNSIETSLLKSQHDFDEVEKKIKINNKELSDIQNTVEELKKQKDALISQLIQDFDTTEFENTEELFSHAKSLLSQQISEFEKNEKKLTQDEQNILHLKQKQQELVMKNDLYKDDLNKLALKLDELIKNKNELCQSLSVLYNFQDIEINKLPSLLDLAKSVIHATAKIESLKQQKDSVLESSKELESLLENDNESLEQNKREEQEIRQELESLYPNYSSVPPQQVQEKREKELEIEESKKETLSKKLSEEEKKRNNFIQQISILSENLKPLELHIGQYVTRLNQMTAKLIKDMPNQDNELIEKLISSLSQISAENALSLDADVIQYVGDCLVNWQNHTKENLSQLLVNTSKLETIISEYHNQLKEREDILKQKDALNAQLARLDNLKEVMNNDGFSKFALSLLEEKLLIYTNKELETLCEGRYQLIEKEVSKRDGPEFFVLDLWQNGLERKVATLSGGETFLISLAMALSLAEMSRGQTDIDTFIIDEGFGTLDDESIEEVLDVLLSIRSRGKQIGLISHIRKLTERIPVNIQMQKIHQGNSSATILYN